MLQVINGNSLEVLPEIIKEYGDRNIIIVSDPPFNMGYHYKTYKDKLKEDEYFGLMSEIFSKAPSVVIHYPESLYKLSYEMGILPTKVVSLVYNSNTAKQHREIAFFKVKPDFRKVTQPYKNPNDKRIKERMARGIMGGAFI